MDYRQYDNTIGRFSSIDALAELSYSGSPYSFANNNPIYFSDPSGLFSSWSAALNYMLAHGSSGTIRNVGDHYSIMSGEINSNGSEGGFYQEADGTMGIDILYNTKISDDGGGSDFGWMSIWGNQKAGDTSGWKGTTTNSLESSDFVNVGNARSVNVVNIFEKIFNIFKNLFSAWDKEEDIEKDIKKNRYTSTMEVQNVEPVAPPAKSIEISMRAFTYSVQLNPFRVDTTSTVIKFNGQNTNQKIDSLINRNELLKEGAINWMKNPN
jgi:hypothetical protein